MFILLINVFILKFIFALVSYLKFVHSNKFNIIIYLLFVTWLISLIGSNLIENIADSALS